MLGKLFRPRGAPPARQQTPPEVAEGVTIDVLAGARAVGLDGGTGMVPWSAVLGNPNDGGRLDELGHFQVAPAGQVEQHRLEDSYYADRPLFGGFRSAPHLGQFREEPALTGGYSVVTGRVQVELGTISFTSEAPTELVRMPVVQSACALRAQAYGQTADDLAAIARSGARQSLGMSS